MTREQAIEILETWFQFVLADTLFEHHEEMHREHDEAFRVLGLEKTD